MQFFFLGMATLMSAAMVAPATAQPSTTPATQPQTMPAKPPFSPSVRVGDILYMSGQIGQSPAGLDPHGAGFDAAVRQAMDSMGRILKDNGLGFQNVVKCTVMLADMADWPRFNAAYVPYFEGLRLPARSAFGTTGLALGAPLEVECIAAFD